MRTFSKCPCWEECFINNQVTSHFKNAFKEWLPEAVHEIEMYRRTVGGGEQVVWGLLWQRPGWRRRRCGVGVAEYELEAWHRGGAESAGKFKEGVGTALGEGVKGAMEGRSKATSEGFHTGCPVCTARRVGDLIQVFKEESFHQQACSTHGPVF